MAKYTHSLTHSPCKQGINQLGKLCQPVEIDINRPAHNTRRVLEKHNHPADITPASKLSAIWAQTPPRTQQS